MKKKRSNKDGSNKDGSNIEGLTPDGTFFKDGSDDIEYIGESYVEGLEGRKYLNLPERPRYLKLSDNQVLDRVHQPSPDFSHTMRLCNERAFNYHPLAGEVSKELRERLKV